MIFCVCHIYQNVDCWKIVAMENFFVTLDLKFLYCNCLKILFLFSISFLQFAWIQLVLARIQLVPFFSCYRCVPHPSRLPIFFCILPFSKTFLSSIAVPEATSLTIPSSGTHWQSTYVVIPFGDYVTKHTQSANICSHSEAKSWVVHTIYSSPSQLLTAGIRKASTRFHIHLVKDR